ncbi:EEF1A lysine methyltransferase 3-like [Chiloscyllium punctatum]|uniref:EEF1A lysine methyltransferase 3-like n=1 Tax=Chiloscyllium punctatum TaxID=137246 RepID=UPI003B63B9BA
METKLQNNYADSEIEYILERSYEFCGQHLWISQSSTAQIGTSGFIWEAGLALCEYIEKQRIIFNGMKVIELGAGTGILGILAVLLGGNVTITDQPNVLKQIEHNVVASISPSCRDRVNIRALSWGHDHIQFPRDYDFIFGGEIVYFPKTYPLLIKTLQHLSSERTIIYLSSKMWQDFQINKFYEDILPEHFNCQIVDRNEENDINVYKVTKKVHALGISC